VAVVTLSGSDSSPVLTFFNPDPAPKIFKFENPTSVQTPATIDATEVQQCFHLRNAICEKHRLLLLTMKSDTGKVSVFFTNFFLRK